MIQIITFIMTATMIMSKIQREVLKKRKTVSNQFCLLNLIFELRYRNLQKEVEDKLSRSMKIWLSGTEDQKIHTIFRTQFTTRIIHSFPKG